MSGSWTQQAKLASDAEDSGELFGNSVTVSNDGSTAVIGASASGDFEGAHSATESPSGGNTSTAEEVNGQSAGAAYVFDGSGGS